MKKKGQVQLGPILLTAIGLIAALVMYQAIVAQIGASTTTVSAVNESYTMGAVETYVDLNGQDYLSTQYISNETSGLALETNNYTIDDGISETTSSKTVRIVLVEDSPYAGEVVNISYTYGPEGYINSSGGRALALLIAIFSALAIAVTALVPALRSGVIDMVKN